MNNPPLNVLVAFPYMKAGPISTLTQYVGSYRLLLDSGAFTAWKSGSPISLDDYCRFIETCPVPLWRYLSLDVIGDEHASLQNYELMRTRGFNPVPVFTRGADVAALNYYYQTSDLVAIGGLVKAPNAERYINGIMRHVAGRKVHLLGYTKKTMIKAHRPYSCDSSGWEGGARYGSLDLYMGRGQWATLKRSDFLAKPSDDIQQRIRFYGAEPRDLGLAKSWSGGVSPLRYLCAASAAAMSIDYEKHMNVLSFSAIAAECGLSLMLQAFTHLRKTGRV
jgi:hypothetical protein